MDNLREEIAGELTHYECHSYLGWDKALKVADQIITLLSKNCYGKMVEKTNCPDCWSCSYYQKCDHTLSDCKRPFISKVFEPIKESK